jgi:hypothetical protein
MPISLGWPRSFYEAPAQDWWLNISNNLKLNIKNSKLLFPFSLSQKSIRGERIP